MLNKHSAAGGRASVGGTAAPGKAGMAKDLTSDLGLSRAELLELLAVARDVKARPREYRVALEGRYISLLFEKPSLRTRLTFELAIKQLGGDSVLSTGTLGDREPLKDMARNLERWTDAIVIRTFSQKKVEELARWSNVPVINALSDIYHPCQALADVFTIGERFSDARGVRVAFVGDGNNVAHSLLLTAPRCGIDVTVASPAGYEPAADVVEQARREAEDSGARVHITNDAREAVSGAQVVYTDVWTSMGQELQAAERSRVFQPFQVDRALMSLAAPDAIFLHCLPARRGEEVLDEVIESPASAVFDQAENRLHTQKALLLMLLGAER